MTYLVPFDGSDLSIAALEQATEFGSVMGEEVIVLVAIPPDDVEFALERGWIDDADLYDVDRIVDRLEQRVREVAPDVTFRVETTENVSSVASRTTDVIRTIREVAGEVGADVVFVGSENAGRVSPPIYSVGAPISEDVRYDVHIVRHT